MKLYISKNNQEYIYISSLKNIESIFDNAIPNDTFKFKLQIKNTSNLYLLPTLKLENIESKNSQYDIRNVFYIVDGLVYINENSYQLIPNSNEDVYFAGQKLNLYRINNLIDQHNSLTLVKDFELEIDDNVEIIFIIKYDEETSSSGYQKGILKTKGFYIYLNPQ